MISSSVSISISMSESERSPVTGWLRVEEATRRLAVEAGEDADVARVDCGEEREETLEGDPVARSLKNLGTCFFSVAMAPWGGMQGRTVSGEGALESSLGQAGNAEGSDAYSGLTCPRTRRMVGTRSGRSRLNMGWK